MDEIKKFRTQARKMSHQLHGELVARIESYGVYTNEAIFRDLTHYDIVLPFQLVNSDVEKAYRIANDILNCVECEGFSSFLMEMDNAHYLCLKFWREG